MSSVKPRRVSITPTGFDPPLLEIVAGQDAVWTNRTSAPVGVTFGDGTDSGALPPGGTYTRTFPTPGDCHYGRSDDPAVTATVRVTADTTAW